MKKILFKSALLALAAPLFLASCSSDSNEPNLPQNDPENFQGIMLNIPQNITRGLADDDEATVNKLKVIVYDATSDSYSGTAAPYMVKDLSGDDVSGITLNPTYTSIPVALPTGKYKLYLVANIDGLNGISVKVNNTAINWTSVTEEALKTAKIEGIGIVDNADVLSSATSRKYLPMGCANSTMKVDGNQLGNTGKIDVTSGSKTTVQADLKFCVAKVICTVVNKDFPSVSLTTPSISGNSSTSGLVNDNNDRTSATGGDLPGAFYNLDSNGDLTTTTTTTPTTSATGWGWTGTFYIGENIYVDASNDAPRTTVTFDFDNDTYDKTRIIGVVYNNAGEITQVDGVKRGNLYQMTGTIKGKTLDVKVSVKPWTYSKTVQDLNEE
ncbi:MAG: hypothetical protein K2G90_09985 [Muribaculaceae bacterium]|nr:hypothetical protein [Muribaculaceae bacterium]